MLWQEEDEKHYGHQVGQVVPSDWGWYTCANGCEKCLGQFCATPVWSKNKQSYRREVVYE